MDRHVQVSRCKRSGAFLLNPLGTFRGYGAYVGINPYREVPSDALDSLLGQTVVDLVVLSGPTGVEFSEAARFLEASRDEETILVRSKYGLSKTGLTTSKLASRFLQAHVEQKHGQKSWVVQLFSYSSRWRSMTGDDQPAVRVKHAAGAAALGTALLSALELPEPRRKSRST